MDLLRDPIWQGIGSIASIIALILYVVAEREKLFPRFNSQPPKEKLSSSMTAKTQSEKIAPASDDFLGTPQGVIAVGAIVGAVIGVIAILFNFLSTNPLAFFRQIGSYGFTFVVLSGPVTAGLFILATLFGDDMTCRDRVYGLLFGISLVGLMVLCIYLAGVIFPSF